MRLIGDAEVAFIVGLLLVGTALFMAFGAPAVVGFGGGVLITLAVALHYSRAQRQADGDD